MRLEASERKQEASTSVKVAKNYKTSPKRDYLDPQLLRRALGIFLFYGGCQTLRL